MSLKRRLAILTVPAMLAIGGGALAVNAASSPTPSPAPSHSESATEAPEAPAGTADVETADPGGDVQSGHADPAGEVDHQATGNESPAALSRQQRSRRAVAAAAFDQLKAAGLTE